MPALLSRTRKSRSFSYCGRVVQLKAETAKWGLMIVFKYEEYLEYEDSEALLGEEIVGMEDIMRM